MGRFVLILLGLVVMSVMRVNSLSCAECDDPPNCPNPPTCTEYGRAPCGCCDVCKLGEGADCSGFTAPCESTLECIGPDGTSYGSRPSWWQFGVVGTCTNV